MILHAFGWAICQKKTFFGLDFGLLPRLKVNLRPAHPTKILDPPPKYAVHPDIERRNKPILRTVSWDLLCS